ncbi:hypothetical protein [Anabaena sp. UHCC 0204]|uniref:hypothetical protein n=1 Tax=Anabaena sp. UHCC 0204 TaxID=2590009 RepID=UPI0014452A90|nr:hypothetical protein [Anabaena sp. UHCC 0204]
MGDLVNSDRTPSTPQKRSHSLQPPKSELTSQRLRYRTPSTSQQRSHPLNSPKAN